MDQKNHRFRDAFLERFLLKFGSKLVPGADAIAGKSASWGGLRRPGNVAFICCPSWLRLGGPLNRSWDNFGTILAPKMAPKSDLGRIWAPKKQIWAPKMVPKLTKNQRESASTWRLIFDLISAPFFELIFVTYLFVTYVLRKTHEPIFFGLKPFPFTIRSLFRSAA